VKIVQEVIDVAGGKVYDIAPEGRLDAVTVPALETALQDQLGGGHVQIVLDLSGVTYLSSSGLRAMLHARRQAQAGGGDVLLSGMTPRVREIFEMIGFNSLFHVFDHVADAAAAFAKSAAA
jgi:anti-anti-sigma factor